MSNTIYTIGHSNRSLEVFLGLLKAHGITLLADVRKIPRSRYNPQFNSEALAAALKAEAIDYTHLPGLGGLRPKRGDSINMGLRNRSFRAYADYMQTEEFDRELDHFLALAEGRRAALMCAEALYWQCHRSMIADALTARNIPVQHIMANTRTEPHALKDVAKVRNARVFYPAEQMELLTEKA